MKEHGEHFLGLDGIRICCSNYSVLEIIMFEINHDQYQHNQINEVDYRISRHIHDE